MVYLNKPLSLMILHLLTNHIFITPANAETSIIEYCSPLRAETSDDWSTTVWVAGNYCLQQNLFQADPILALPHQAVSRSPILSVRSSNVIIDLKQHKLDTRISGRTGIWINSLRNTKIENINIKNGLISTSNGFSVYIVDAFDDGKNNRFGRSLSVAESNGNLSLYRQTRYTLENMTIISKERAILMQGMGNTIRHCKIVGGNRAVILLGPNMVFEDNEIILHASSRQDAGDERPVALYLEDAANSIVRNNRITIEGRIPNADAIVLKNSTDVQLEGNTVVGTNRVYRTLDATSSVKDSANTATLSP